LLARYFFRPFLATLAVRTISTGRIDLSWLLTEENGASIRSTLFLAMYMRTMLALISSNSTAKSRKMGT